MLKQHQGKIIQQQFKSKHSGHKISSNQRKSSIDESGAHIQSCAGRKVTSADTIKIDVTIPTLCTLSTSFNCLESNRVKTTNHDEVARYAACYDASIPMKCSEDIDGDEDTNESSDPTKEVGDHSRSSKMKVEVESNVIESNRNECDDNGDEEVDERFVSMMLEDLKMSSKGWPHEK